MSLILPLQSIEQRILLLVDEAANLPLVWGPATNANNAPNTLHIAWNVITFATTPLEVGWALASVDDAPPDETTGEIQFDFYARATDGTAPIRQHSHTIRGHFRGVIANGVRYGSPTTAEWIGTQPDGWIRYVQRVPFTIEDA